MQPHRQHILLCGAGGFIGQQLHQRLSLAGHVLIPLRSHALDFNCPPAAPAWLPWLRGVDAVINTVGVLRDGPGRSAEALHHLTPSSLFQACVQAGVRRVIHLSALGVAGGDTRYARTKRAGDEVLLALHAAGQLQATVLRPSLVFGAQGHSSRMLLRLARLPVLVLPAVMQHTRIQPLAVQDLAEACVRLLHAPQAPAVLDAAGPQPLSVAAFIAVLRHQLGHPPARVRYLPDGLTRWSARLGDLIPHQPWCSETLRLLAHDNVTDPTALATWLGRPPLAPEALLSAVTGR